MMKAKAATNVIGRVGSSPSHEPTSTEIKCTKAVASVIPISTGTVLYRVANVNAISWLLSPNSATKITAALMRNASTPRRTLSLDPAGGRPEGQSGGCEHDGP